jgi:hypothetical protein
MAVPDIQLPEKEYFMKKTIPDYLNRVFGIGQELSGKRTRCSCSW